MLKIRKGDRVLITAGKAKGRKGKVVRVLPRESRVVVEGINLYRRHVKPRGQSQKGEVVERERPLPVSNVAVWCSKCKKPTRVGFDENKEGMKVRVCRKCGKELG